MAHAQSTGVNGVVQRVDVPSCTLYLTDGRSVTLAPGARVLAGGREIGLGEVQPGWTLVTVRASATGPESVVDVARTTLVHRGSEALALDRVESEAEVAVRGVAASSATAEGSALPRPTATAPVVDAAEVQVLWMPPSR